MRVTRLKEEVLKEAMLLIQSLDPRPGQSINRILRQLHQQAVTQIACADAHRIETLYALQHRFHLFRCIRVKPRNRCRTI
jgi:hypothetical protein